MLHHTAPIRRLLPLSTRLDPRLRPRPPSDRWSLLSDIAQRSNDPCRLAGRGRSPLELGLPFFLLVSHSRHAQRPGSIVDRFNSDVSLVDLVIIR
jgi:hypothetical protein